MKTVFKALDGTIFENETECRQYEKEFKNQTRLSDVLTILQNFCDTQCDCESCCLNNDDECALTVLNKSLNN